MKPQVSIIIPTPTGGLSHLANLMPALSKEPNAEIIIIDNNSKDGTLNYLGNYECTVLVNTQNKNFSESNNMGARKALGDYLLFMNNDIVITPGLVQTMVDTFSIDEKIAVVGCLLCLRDYPKKVQHAGVFFTEEYFPYELGLAQPFGVPELPYNDPRVRSVREVPSVTAACMMVRKDVYNELGGFDEVYVYSWEDTDFNLKVREKGYKIYYNGNAHALHKHFGSKDRGRFNREAENRARYDNVFIKTGRAKQILGDFINGGKL